MDGFVRYAFTYRPKQASCPSKSNKFSIEHISSAYDNMFKVSSL
jgi:hypothetical protein